VLNKGYLGPTACETKMNRVPAETLDLLLHSYATGQLSPGMHALMGAHLSLRPQSRPLVAAIEEQMGRRILGDAAIASPVNRDERLAQIFAREIPPTRPAPRHDEFLPLPLASYLGKSMDDLPWRTVLPGIKEAVIDKSDSGEVSMLWIRKGRTMPSHTHDGLEATLVLGGSFSDASGAFYRGDIALVDGDTDHRPVAGMEEDCVCFAVSESRPRLTGPVGRWFNWLSH
jgi:putative transcriptional regulator